MYAACVYDARMPPKQTVSEVDKMRVAIEAECGLATVSRYLRGDDCRNTGRRIARAIAKLGLDLPRGQRDTAS